MNEQNKAITELFALKNERLEEAKAYGALAEKEALHLFTAQNKGFLRLSPEEQNALLDNFTAAYPTLSFVRFAAMVEEAYGLGAQLAKKLPHSPSPMRIALPLTRYSALLREKLPADALFVDCGGFEEACDKVLDGLCDTAALPYLDEGGRQIGRTQALCRDYALKKQKIILTEEERSAFALLSSTLYAQPGASYAEISFPANEETIEELSALARLVCRAPLASLQGGAAFLTLHGATEELYRFLSMAQFFSDIEITGLYDCI